MSMTQFIMSETKTLPVTNENKVFLSSIVLGIKPMSNLPQTLKTVNFDGISVSLQKTAI